MNIIVYYALKISGIAGFTSTTNQMWGTVIVRLVNMMVTFIAIGMVDPDPAGGNKPTLKLGFMVIAIGMDVLGVLWHMGVNIEFQKYFAIVMLIWILYSEI